MSIIATARVPRLFDLRFSPTGQFPRLFPSPHPRQPEAGTAVPVPVGSACRPWCADAGSSDHCHGSGECMAEPISQPATAGQYEVSDHGAVFPMLTTYAVIPDVGQPSAVRLEIGGPSPFTSGGDMSGWVDMTPAEARALAYRLLADADTVEADRRAA